MNQKYYILKPSVGTKETGMVYPALESYEDYDFSKADSCYKLDSDKFPDFIPDIKFKLARGAKLCDVMEKSNITACGLLVSQRVKDVFEKFSLVPHKYFNATIEDKGTIYHYYWLHLVWENGIKHLNFQESKFQINEFGEILDELNLASYQELLDKQTELGFMKMIHNYCSTFQDIEYDLFIHPLNKTIYVSKNIYTALTHKSFSGLDISEATKLVVR